MNDLDEAGLKDQHCRITMRTLTPSPGLTVTLIGRSPNSVPRNLRRISPSFVRLDGIVHVRPVQMMITMGGVCKLLKKVEADQSGVVQGGFVWALPSRGIDSCGCACAFANLLDIQ
jgi:hypothetical protein